MPKKKEAGRDKAVCYRCGRKGHWIKNCYANVSEQRKKRSNY